MLCIRKISKMALLASLLAASAQNLYAMDDDPELLKAIALSKKEFEEKQVQAEKKQVQDVMAKSEKNDPELLKAMARSKKEFEKKQVQAVMAKSKQDAPVLNTDDPELLEAIALSTQSGKNPEVDEDLIIAQSIQDAWDLEEKLCEDMIAKSLEEHIENKVSKVQEGRPIEARNSQALSLGKFFTKNVELQPNRDPVIWTDTHKKIAEKSQDNKPVTLINNSNSSSVNSNAKAEVDFKKLQEERAKRMQEREEKAKAEAVQKKVAAEKAEKEAEARRKEAERTRLESIQKLEASRQKK